MPRLAANLSMMFNEVDFLDRFAAAASAGFEAVEFLFPYDHPAAELRRRLDDNGLTQALFNMPPGDWAAGDRGMAALPGRQAAFRESVKKALDYAAALDCKLVHCMAGIVPADVAPVTAGSVYAANLAWAAEHAPPRRGQAGDRADQPSRHAGLLPEHPGAGRSHRRGDRRRPPRAAVRRLSLPDHRGRRHQADGEVSAGDRPHADRRCAGAQRAGHRRDRLALSCSAAWTSWATPAGSAANIARPATPWPDLPGASSSGSDQPALLSLPATGTT